MLVASPQSLPVHKQVNSLQNENMELKAVMTTLKAQLDDIKERSTINNGSELSVS